MHAIDMHCDTLMNQYMTVRKKLGFADPLNIDGANILDGDTMVNLERLRQAEAMAQFLRFLCFPIETTRSIVRLIRCLMKSILRAVPRYLKQH